MSHNTNDTTSDRLADAIEQDEEDRTRRCWHCGGMILGEAVDAPAFADADATRHAECNGASESRRVLDERGELVAAALREGITRYRGDVDADALADLETLAKEVEA